MKSKNGQCNNIDVYTYSHLMSGLLRERYDSMPLESFGNKNCFEYMARIPDEAKYDKLLSIKLMTLTYLGMSVRMLLKDEEKSSLYVFYDTNRKVFEKKYENAFAIYTPPYVLGKNICNIGAV